MYLNIWHVEDPRWKFFLHVENSFTISRDNGGDCGRNNNLSRAFTLAKRETTNTHLVMLVRRFYGGPDHPYCPRYFLCCRDARAE